MSTGKSNAAGCAPHPRGRRGTVAILSAIVLGLLLAIVALALDVGYMKLARTELQAAADAGALAGVSALHGFTGGLQTDVVTVQGANTDAARLEAQKFVRYFQSGGRSLDVNLNVSNQPSGDIVTGRLYIPGDLAEPLDVASDTPNSVYVRVPLEQTHQNGSLSLYFARVIGVNAIQVSAAATAKAQYPRVLPVAADQNKWNTLAAGGDGDNFTYNYHPNGTDFGVQSGPDGIPEIQIQPGAWDGNGMPPGNFARIEIGPGGSAMDVMRRQFDQGPNPPEFDYHGGSLYASMGISGATGIKSSIKHAILGGNADGRTYQGMLGEVAYLPLYTSATGNGANAVFTLSRFVAVRIMSITIDGRGRTTHLDSNGNVVEEIVIQPVVNPNDLNRPYLVR